MFSYFFCDILPIWHHLWIWLKIKKWTVHWLLKAFPDLVNSFRLNLKSQLLLVIYYKIWFNTFSHTKKQLLIREGHVVDKNKPLIFTHRLFNCGTIFSDIKENKWFLCFNLNNVIGNSKLSLLSCLSYSCVYLLQLW